MYTKLKFALLTLAVFAGLTLGSTPAQANCAAVPGSNTLVFLTPSLNAAQTQLTLSVNGVLYAEKHSEANECVQEAGGPEPFCTWLSGVASQTSPSNTVSITSGPSGVSGTIGVSVAGADPGSGCFDKGNGASFSGSRTIDVSGLANGTYSVTVSARDNLASQTDTDTKSFTISNRPVNYALTVTRAGTGSCTVTSSPAGISCGADCSESYASGTSVTLTGTPASGSGPVQWGGACSGAGSCTVSMTQARSVTATCNANAVAPTATLTATPSSVNMGQTSTLSWGSTNATSCSVTAGSANGFAITGGATSGSDTTTALTGNTTFSISCTGAGGTATASATVSVNGTYTLTVTKAGTGTGTVTGTNINCGSDCDQTYNAGVTRTLTATPATGSTFTGWGGACTGGTNTTSNNILMDGNKTCTATFNLTSTPTALACSGPTSAVVGETKTFSATGGTAPYTWATTFGTPSTGSGASFNTSWASNNAGTQRSVVLTDSTGTIHRCYIDIVSAPPTCSAPSAPLNPGDSVTFTASGGASGTYSWSGTGATPSTGTGTTFTASYDTPGAKNMTVTRNGQSGTCAVTVIPVCSASPTTVPAGQSVTFTGGGTASALYDWSAVGGSPSSASQAHALTTTYSTSGTKIAYLTRNSQTGSCTVAVSNILTGSCSVSPATQATGQPVMWSAAASGGSVPYTYSWSGTDSLSGSSANVTKTYTAAGTKTGTVTISSGGQSITKTCTMTVNPVVPPMCGSANGTAVATAPTTNLCSAGTASAVSGTGPWTWSCTGSAGTTAVSCSAPKTVTPPPTVTLTASPNPIYAGNTTTLTWSSANATSCSVTGGASSGFAITGSATSGSDATVALNNTTTFSVSCTGAGGTANASVTVNVTPECLVAGQTALVNQSVTLTGRGGNGVYTWSAPGGATASGSGASFSTSYGSVGTKSITVTSAGVTSTACTVTVSVVPPQTGTIVVISQDNNGQPFPATWTLSGGQSGSIPQTSPSTGVTYPNQSVGAYTLTAGSVAGYTSAIAQASSQSLAVNETKTFTITYTPVAGASVEISANPMTVNSGSASLLSWTSSNIVPGSCEASGGWGGPKGDSGSQSTGTLTSDTTYTITCNQLSGGGTVSDSVTVSVTPQGDDDDGGGAPECSDGADNGDPEDELADEDDPDCYPGGVYDPNDDNETFIPSPTSDDDDDTVHACNDGFDNDGDGSIDGADSGCDNEDTSEQDTPDIREI